MVQFERSATQSILRLGEHWVREAAAKWCRVSIDPLELVNLKDLPQLQHKEHSQPFCENRNRPIAFEVDDLAGLRSSHATRSVHRVGVV